MCAVDWRTSEGPGGSGLPDVLRGSHPSSLTASPPPPCPTPPHRSLCGAQLTQVQQQAVGREGGPKLLLQVVSPV